jgi:hypothetical protein
MSDWKNASQGLGVGFELRIERWVIKTHDKAKATPETQVR